MLDAPFAPGHQRGSHYPRVLASRWYSVPIALAIAALVCAPTAAADEDEALFLVLLDERGIIIPEDETMLTAIAAGRTVCDRLQGGSSVTEVTGDVAAGTPNLNSYGISIFVGTAIEVFCPEFLATEPVPGVSPPPAPSPKPAPSQSFYPNCAAVRAAGAAPLHRGEPGYSTKLDRDGDGVACEK